MLPVNLPDLEIDTKLTSFAQVGKISGGFCGQRKARKLCHLHPTESLVLFLDGEPQFHPLGIPLVFSSAVMSSDPKTLALQQ